MSADATIARTIADYLRERLALVRWFRMNASVKHGVPLDEPAQPSPAEPQSVTNNYYYARKEPLASSAPTDQAPQQPVQQVATERPKPDAGGSWLRRGAPWVIGAATLAGGGAGGYALSQWLAGGQSSVSVPAPSVEGGLPYESPLQWLEDRGENRP